MSLADEVTQPPAAVSVAAPRRTVSVDVLAGVVTALTARITTLEGIVEDLTGACEALKASSTAHPKGLARVVLRLVEDEDIRAAIAWAVKWIGSAIAIAILVMVGANLSYGDFTIGTPADDNRARVESPPAPEPVTVPPSLGTSPDP